MSILLSILIHLYLAGPRSGCRYCLMQINISTTPPKGASEIAQDLIANVLLDHSNFSLDSPEQISKEPIGLGKCKASFPPWGLENSMTVHGT